MNLTYLKNCIKLLLFISLTITFSFPHPPLSRGEERSTVVVGQNPSRPPPFRPPLLTLCLFILWRVWWHWIMFFSSFYNWKKWCLSIIYFGSTWATPASYSLSKTCFWSPLPLSIPFWLKFTSSRTLFLLLGLQNLAPNPFYIAFLWWEDGWQM